jgi:hypothetical protein
MAKNITKHEFKQLSALVPDLTHEGANRNADNLRSLLDQQNDTRTSSLTVKLEDQHSERLAKLHKARKQNGATPN